MDEDTLFYPGILLTLPSFILFLVAIPGDESKSCIALPSAKTQWLDYQGGKNPRHYVYLTGQEPNTFCRVDDKPLYDMGIGYTTAKAYSGILKEQP